MSLCHCLLPDYSVVLTTTQYHCYGDNANVSYIYGNLMKIFAYAQLLSDYDHVHATSPCSTRVLSPARPIMSYISLLMEME